MLHAKILHKHLIGLLFYKALVLQGRVSCALAISKRFDCEGKATWRSNSTRTAKRIKKSYRKGWKLLQSGDYEGAIMPFLDGSELCGDDFREIVLSSFGKYAAYRYQDQGLLTAIFFICVAICEEKRGQLPTANCMLERAHKIEPDLLHGGRLRASCLFRVGNLDGALQVIYNLLEFRAFPQVPKGWPEYLFHRGDRWWQKVEQLKKDIEAAMQAKSIWGSRHAQTATTKRRRESLGAKEPRRDPTSENIIVLFTYLDKN